MKLFDSKMSVSETFDYEDSNVDKNVQFLGNSCDNEDAQSSLDNVSCPDDDDDEMIDIAAWPSHSVMNWEDSRDLENIEERFFNNKKCASNESLSYVKSSNVCDVMFDNDIDKPGCSSQVSEANHSSEYDEEYEELKQFNGEDSNVSEEMKTLVGVNELIRKFSKIELLRQRENLKKIEETNQGVSSSCSSSILHDTSPKPWDYEGLMDDEKFNVPDPRCGYNNPKVKLDESDSDSESEKFREIELIKKLVKHALANEKQDREKRDDVLTSSKVRGEEEVFTDPFDNTSVITQRESGTNVTEGADSSNKDQEAIPFLLETNGGDCSSVFNTIFDGYEIDRQESFHDWMIDVVLSRDLESCDMDGRSNSFL